MMWNSVLKFKIGMVKNSNSRGHVDLRWSEGGETLGIMKESKT